MNQSRHPMHLALVCPDLTGHLNPMTTLGRALVRDGHRVTLCGTEASRVCAERSGLAFLEIGRAEQAAGCFAAAQAKLGELHGFAAVRFTGKMLQQAAAIVLRDAPEAFAHLGIDGVVVDQVSPAGNTVAELLHLPYCVACNALALNMEPAVPPPVLSWPYRTGPLGRIRNRAGNWLLTRAAAPVFAEVNAFRVRHGLKGLQPSAQEHGELMQVAQQPAFLDFRREQLPNHFHYTGPWHELERDANLAFPWERLDGRPLVYASLGTLQNRLQHLFVAIADACAGLDAQLVLSLGRYDGALRCRLPAGAIVIPYAPQLQLLKRAAAVVTHAGLNTALEALACGLPMVALPLTNDQPGVALRLVALGVAITLPPKKVTPQRLRRALQKALHEPCYRAAAQHWQRELRSAPDARYAAALVGRALGTGRRLTREEAARLPRDAGVDHQSDKPHERK